MLEKTPYFLMAMPGLLDPNFDKGIVLMMNHSSSGAFGYCINKPADLSFKDFSRMQGIDCHKSLEYMPVLRGGPVDTNRCWILHGAPEIEEKTEIAPGVFLSLTIESLARVLKEGIRPVRLILGYAGWGPGQLEKEMTDGLWMTASLNHRYIFEVEPTYAWKVILEDMGIDPTNLVSGTGIH